MKKKLMIVVVFSLITLLFSAGCGSRDINEAAQPSAAAGQMQGEAVEGSGGVPQLNIYVISDSFMGDGFISMFEEGVQKQLDQMGNGSRMNGAVYEDSASELIDKGLSEGYDGIILVGNVDQETTGAIGNAEQNGLPVLSPLDNMANGYNSGAPAEMGKAMAESLVSRIALSKGFEEWGDQEDFGKQIGRAVQGNWITGNSSGDMKTFVFPYVMEFAQNPSGMQEMKRVSLIEEVNDTPDGKGYNYVLNTGNNYYLYPQNPHVLECHWEPDGYSGSDSLVKASDDSGDGPGLNSIFVLDMNTYSDSEEYFQGTLTTFEGHGAMGGGPEECVALNLGEPLRVIMPDGRDFMLCAIQLNMDSSLSEYADTGKIVTVTGRLFEAETDHHFTPVIMNVSKAE